MGIFADYENLLARGAIGTTRPASPGNSGRQMEQDRCREGVRILDPEASPTPPQSVTASFSCSARR